LPLRSLFRYSFPLVLLAIAVVLWLAGYLCLKVASRAPFTPP
jgi:hypothetical protein